MSKKSTPDQIRRAWSAMSEIVDTASAERRELTESESLRYTQNETILNNGEAVRGSLSVADRHEVYDDVWGATDGAMPTPWPSVRSRNETPTEDKAILGPEHRMADWVAADSHRSKVNEPTDLDTGKLFRGMLTGRWDGAAAEQRAMSEGTAGNGGYTVPTITSAQIIDLARNQTQVIRAGARTIPLETQITNVPRQTADPAATWMSENAQSTDSPITFDQVTFTAQTLRFLVLASRELVEDSIVSGGLGGLVASSIASKAALEVDRVSLRGSGTPPEPKGLLNQTGITKTSLGTNGGAATWDTLRALALTVRGANFEPSAYIHAPRTEDEIAGTKDSQGRYLVPPVNIAGISRLTSNQIPINLTTGTSNLTSEIYAGDFSQLWIGMRTELSLMALDQRYVDYNQVGFFAFLRADVQLAHPLAFAVNTGVL
jgi:HK97 family phage major capsid protein